MCNLNRNLDFWILDDQMSVLDCIWPLDRTTRNAHSAEVLEGFPLGCPLALDKMLLGLPLNYRRPFERDGRYGRFVILPWH